MEVVVVFGEGKWTAHPYSNDREASIQRLIMLADYGGAHQLGNYLLA